MTFPRKNDSLSRLIAERTRLRNHNTKLMDELKSTQRKLKELQTEHAALIDATQPDSRTRLLAELSELLNPTED